MDFNEIYGKVATHNNVTNHKTTGFSSLSLENTFLEEGGRDSNCLPNILESIKN